jgi:hypothetical protein
MQPLVFPLSLAASILLFVQEFQTTGYPITASDVNICRMGCKYAARRPGHKHKNREENRERVKCIHIRYKNNTNNNNNNFLC